MFEHVGDSRSASALIRLILYLTDNLHRLRRSSLDRVHVWHDDLSELTFGRVDRWSFERHLVMRRWSRHVLDVGLG